MKPPTDASWVSTQFASSSTSVQWRSELSINAAPSDEEQLSSWQQVQVLLRPEASATNQQPSNTMCAHGRVPKDGRPVNDGRSR